jgi:hypothetical protein
VNLFQAVLQAKVRQVLDQYIPDQADEVASEIILTLTGQVESKPLESVDTKLIEVAMSTKAVSMQEAQDIKLGDGKLEGGGLRG